MAIQRLHKENSYSKGKERRMNESEFIKTMNYSLSFINIKPEEALLKTIFSEIDLDRDNWITYSDYFLFLLEYFGSISEAAQKMETNKIVRQKQKELVDEGRLDKSLLNSISEQEPDYNNRQYVTAANREYFVNLNRLIVSQALLSSVYFDSERKVSLTQRDVKTLAKDKYASLSGEV